MLDTSFDQYTAQYTAYSIFGGAMSIFGGKEIRPTRLFVNPDEKIVVDGHNLIHDLHGGKITGEQFEEGLDIVSNMVVKAFPSNTIHIVIKNPNHLPEQLVSRKPYLDKITNISKNYPHVSYHLAYDDKTIGSGSQHYMKGRDDFLSVYLAKNNYIVSKDRFRDFNDFDKIPTFTHYIIQDGVVNMDEKIIPKHHMGFLEKPTKGNHLIYHIGDREYFSKYDLNHGEIHKIQGDIFPKIYLMRD